MIHIRFKKEWTPRISDWGDSFDPTKYVWVVEDGRWHDKDAFVDLIALNAPHGEWFRCLRTMITLSDVINLYDSNLSKKSKAYGYDENGNWVFKDQTPQ